MQKGGGRTKVRGSGGEHPRSIALAPFWTRVPLTPRGATFVLDLDTTATPRAVVVDASRATVTTRGGAVGVVSVEPGSVAYAKARARGVSLLFGVRGRAGAPSTARFVRHVGGGGGGTRSTRVAVYVLRDIPLPASSSLARRYAYARPNACDACVRYGLPMASALVSAAIDTHATRRASLIEAPDTDDDPVLPNDAYQVLEHIARELE